MRVTFAGLLCLLLAAGGLADPTPAPPLTLVRPAWQENWLNLHSTPPTPGAEQRASLSPAVTLTLQSLKATGDFEATLSRWPYIAVPNGVALDPSFVRPADPSVDPAMILGSQPKPSVTVIIPRVIPRLPVPPKAP